MCNSNWLEPSSISGSYFIIVWVQLKRTVVVTDVSKTWAEVIFRVWKWPQTFKMTSSHAVETSFIIKTAVFLQGFPAKRKALRNIRISSEFLGNVRKRLCGLRTAFGESSEIFGKWSEIFKKSSSWTLEEKFHIYACPCIYVHVFIKNSPFQVYDHTRRIKQEV